MHSRAVIAMVVGSFFAGACTPPPPVIRAYTLGGTLTGLAGAAVVLQDEGANSLTVTKDGPFTFPQTFSQSTPYFITVLTQPASPAQTCTIASASGTAGTADVTSIAVTCATTLDVIGGSVTGLEGSGLVLEDNGGDDLTVSADGSFTFATPLASGAAYAVTVSAQPTAPSQTCVVTSGTGTAGTEPVTSVLVACATDTFTVGGSISGLAGTGLVLEDNGGDDLAVTSGSAFTFATPIASGGLFAVTVKTQPTNPTQTCTVSGGSGTVVGADITSVTVSCSSNTYTIGGVVLGLAGSGLVLQDNGGDNLSVAANGLFSFATPIASGGAYSVSVLTQPGNPAQTCAVTGASGTVGTGNVISVTVSCAANTYALSGTVTGLSGSGLVLQDNGGDDLSVTASATTFAFLSPLASGATYTIAVATQPTMPSQTCVVSSGASGTVGSAPITGIAVTCTTNAYPVGGTILGLSGSGLVLQDNGGDDLSVTANGLFSFATPVDSGAAFAVSVVTQPSGPAQSCVVAAGAGTVGAGPVNAVIVSCATNQYPVSGTLTGLVGSGLQLSLNGQAPLPLGADGMFAFVQTLAAGGAYAIAVVAQPASPAQTCVVSNDPAGTIGDAPVADVGVTCTTNTYPVGGTVVGLVGSGLVLQDNGGDNLSVTADGTFTFPTSIASEATFGVTVLTQPSAPAQTCVVTGATGAVVNAAVASVTVNCGVNDYTVSGTATGLLGSGLVLALNGTTDLVVQSNGTFSFPQALTDGTAYAVTIVTQPSGPSQTCVLTGATGTIAAASVSDVGVSCNANTYPISVSVTGLAGSGLVLEDNGADTLAVPTSGSYTFMTLVASGAPYVVTVSSQPGQPSQTCVVTNSSGTVAGAAVGNVTVACTTNTYSVGGTVVGLAGTVVLEDNASDTLIVSPPATSGASSPFTFATPVASGAPYTVTVSQQPGSPSQSCVVTQDPSGTMGSASVTDVVITCTTNAFSLDVTVVGLVGSGLVLQDNAGDNVPVSSNGTVTLPTPQASGTTYTVSVLDQPTGPAQTCNVISGTGTVGASEVTGITVNCGTNQYAIGGAVSGLLGAGLVIADNVGDILPISGNGTFSFPTLYSSGAPWSVSVQTQPQGPSQVCTVAPGAGIVGTGNVTSVAITCATSSFTVSVDVTGLSGSGLTLADNASDTLSVTQDGLYAFAMPVPSGAPYAVTVLSQPALLSQTCSVTAPTGTIAGGNVTLAVTCATNQYSLSVNVTGLSGSGLTLVDDGLNTLTVSGNGTFQFPTTVPSGWTYSVTAATQPTNPTQVCSVPQGQGQVQGASVVLAVNCSTTTFSVGGLVSGLATGESVSLTTTTGTGSYDVTTIVSANGAFTFPGVPSGVSYTTVVSKQPATPLSQTCTVASGTGTVGSANVTNIAVACTAASYTVGGTVSGYSGSGLVLQDNGSSTVAVSANGAFTFPAPVASGSTYTVSVLTQPTTLSQTCTVASGTGTVGSGTVSNVSVTCVTNTYAVGGTVTGLAGGSVVLQNGTSSNTVTVSANGAFSFAAPVASGGAYAVTVQTLPTSPTEGCTVTNGTGTVTNNVITNIVVACTTATFTVSGTVSGLTGSGLVLLLNGANGLAVTGAAASFGFSTAVASGAPYAVTIGTQPSIPTQTCAVTNGSGTVGAANITNVAIACTTNTYSVSATVSGTFTGSLVLQDNGASNLTFTAAGTQTFAAGLTSGTAYAVTVATQPTTGLCFVSNGSGTITNANITNVAVTCTIASGSTSTISATPGPANAALESSTILLTVIVKDASGDLLSGAPVTLTGSATGNTFSPVSGTTNSNGVFTSTLTQTTLGAQTITATIAGGVQVTCSTSLAGWTLVTTTVASALDSVSPKQYLYASGAVAYESPATIAPWNWTIGTQVTGTYLYTATSTSTSSFVCTGSGEVPYYGIGCSAGPGATYKVASQPGSTPASGLATICQNEPGVLGTSATCPSNISIYVRLMQTGASPVGAVSATTSSIVANWGATASTLPVSNIVLTVLAEDASGNLLSGQAVTLSGSGTFTPTSGTTNASGVFTSTLVQPGPGAQTITATIGTSTTVTTTTAYVGWTLVTSTVAGLLDAAGTKWYLYTFGSAAYESPATADAWTWSSGQVLTGTYSYTTNGSNVGTFSCPGNGSGENPEWGVGCSSGPGGTYKVLPYYGDSPGAGWTEICQDAPGAFGGACQSPCYVYVTVH